MVKNILNKIKLLFAGLIILVVISIVYFLSYSIAEPKAYDFMTQNVLVQKFPFDKYKQVHGSDDVVLIMIDSKSSNAYRWPWKRELYCDMLNYLSEYGSPKVIIHDIIFNTLDTSNPQSDKKYFNCVKNLNNYIMGFMPLFNEWEDQKAGEEYDKIFENKYSVNIEDKTSGSINVFNSLIPMPKPYFDVVKNTGSVLLFFGPISGSFTFSDEICRYQNYFLNYKGAYYPSISMRAFLMLNKISQITLTDNEMIFPELNRKIKQIHTPFQNIVPIKFYQPYDNGYSHQSYSAIDIINSYRLIKNGQKPIINPEIFKDKVVVIGANVTAGDGLNDKKNSAVEINHPGADIQATAIDNLIHDDFLFVIPQIVNFIITLLGILILYFSVKTFNLSKSVLAIFSLIIGYVVLCIACFYFNVVINVITPIVMFVLTTIFAYTNKYVIENKNKEKVKNAMGKYMSQDVMQRVVEDIDNLGLGGKKSVVTVLFADIRGFTSLSEKMSAQQVSEFLNEYFSEMEPIITNYNGIINKFIGDAIMAVFGEPIRDENHPENAVKCAYEMLKRVEKLHKKWEREGKPEIEIGIGINTGEVFVGNIGSVNRMEYTVIGDTVNLASRLESYNKMYKTKMLISTSTYKFVKNIADVIKIPEVQIRGKANKIDIYEVLKVKID